MYSSENAAILYLPSSVVWSIPSSTSLQTLNYEYMEDYIKTHGSEEEYEKNLAEFKEQKLISLCHSTSRRYPTIKKWFLAKYPEVMECGMPDAAEESNNAEDNEVAFDMPVKISA